MRIALISKLWEPSDPYSTGGTGAVVGNLADGLVRRGHKVTVFGTGNSRTKARLISVTSKPYSDKNPYSENKEFKNIANAFERTNEFDIIDCHVEHKSLFFSRLAKVPVVHTIEYGQIGRDVNKLFKEYRRENFIVISNALKNKLKFLNIKTVIHNGLDINHFPFNQSPNNYFLFLGRISPQKGPDIAIKIARRLKLKLILAGKTNRADSEYLEKKIFPYIDGKRVKYVGEVKFTRKLQLLKNAYAVLHPHTYFEAFGLVPIEAQACGTPVIAFPGGASREIVKHGCTGFIVKDINTATQAIKKLNTISRHYCRQFVEKNFDVDKMVAAYEKIYNKIIKYGKK